MTTAAAPLPDRAALVRRSVLLNRLTLGYNLVEGLVALAAGVAAGSVALVSFGVDSGIELGASVVALWRLSHEGDAARVARAEPVAHRLIGGLLLLLAAYVAWEAGGDLRRGERPGTSMVGLALAAASVVVMPLLARAKRRVGRALRSSALVAESRQTAFCTWLSAILLAGLALNALLGWWWADPVAALAMVPIIGWEGVQAVRGRDLCGCGDACHG
mgnify:CR=1 FL=1